MSQEVGATTSRAVERVSDEVGVATRALTSSVPKK
jgi:hypothetical protein